MTTLQSIFFSKTHSPKIHVNRNTTFREKKTHAALANFSINAQFDEWMSDGRDTNWSHAHIAIPSRVEIPILKPAPIIPSSIFGFLFHFLAFYTLHLSLRRFSSLAPLYHPVFHHLSTSVKLFFFPLQMNFQLFYQQRKYNKIYHNNPFEESNKIHRRCEFQVRKFPLFFFLFTLRKRIKNLAHASG